jgi:hypothetical protein
MSGVKPAKLGRLAKWMELAKLQARRESIQRSAAAKKVQPRACRRDERASRIRSLLLLCITTNLLVDIHDIDTDRYLQGGEQAATLERLP